MTIGIPKETYPGESRIAVVPGVLASLTKAGLKVRIEKGAGLDAGFPDASFIEAGAEIVDSRKEVFESDVILQVRAGGANLLTGSEDLALLKKGQVLISFLDPLGETGATKELAATGVTALSMELMPRIARAQSMDALSSQATVAGYKAVLLGAVALKRMFPMMMTAAGTLTPARVFIIGAGVAGLQAIATARRLGAVVEAYDVRPVVKEQVESLGAKFVEFDLDAGDAEDKGGYAKAKDDEFYKRQQAAMLKVIRNSHLVVTTAAVPGKKAPILVTEEMVKAMAPGSVVMDLAAERGGNCALTQPGHDVNIDGVMVLGPNNLASMVPYHASQMYAKNITTFLLHLVKDGKVNLDVEDEITRETLVAKDGDVTHAGIREMLGLAPMGSEQPQEQDALRAGEPA